ncbi:hypothetical protein [Pseudolysinimonas kribbensis]|nr:hypothetical protein [Pseudolysinimonas kribbensis]
MTNNTTIEVPADPEEAVRLLRHELRGARRRLAEARHTAGFATVRLLAGTRTDDVSAVARTAPGVALGHGVSAGFPR